jgi:hypothetical protein
MTDWVKIVAGLLVVACGPGACQMASSEHIPDGKGFSALLICLALGGAIAAPAFIRAIEDAER